MMKDPWREALPDGVGAPNLRRLSRGHCRGYPNHRRGPADVVSSGSGNIFFSFFGADSSQVLLMGEEVLVKGTGRETISLVSLQGLSMLVVKIVAGVKSLGVSLLKKLQGEFREWKKKKGKTAVEKKKKNR